MRLIVSAALVLAAGVAGCSCSKSGNDAEANSAGPCDGDNPAEGCGEQCDDATRCPTGLYCGTDGQCTADCFAETGEGCEDGVCRVDGRCDANGGDDDDRPDGEVCAGFDSFDRIPPNVMLVVDNSGSMNDPMPNDADDRTRWEVAGDVLVAPGRNAEGECTGGLVFCLQDAANFGLAIYTSEPDEPDDLPAGETWCPRINGIPTGAPVDPNGPNPTGKSIIAPSTTNQFRAISNIMRDADNVPSGNGLGTPTGDSVQRVLTELKDVTLPPGGKYLVLVTDGEPDTCENGDDTAGGMRESENAVKAAVKAGYTVYVIGIVPDPIPVEDKQFDVHLTKLAKLGRPNVAGVDYFPASDADALRGALLEIGSGIVGCTVPLNGTIPEGTDECRGTVLVDDEPIECNKDWKLVGRTRIELLGASCEAAKAGASVNARFPCGIVDPLQ